MLVKRSVESFCHHLSSAHKKTSQCLLTWNWSIQTVRRGSWMRSVQCCTKWVNTLHWTLHCVLIWCCCVPLDEQILVVGNVSHRWEDVDFTLTFVQGNEGVQRAKDLIEFMLGHNRQLQHGVMIRLRRNHTSDTQSYSSRTIRKCLEIWQENMIRIRAECRNRQHIKSYAGTEFSKQGFVSWLKANNYLKVTYHENVTFSGFKCYNQAPSASTNQGNVKKRLTQ